MLGRIQDVVVQGGIELQTEDDEASGYMDLVKATQRSIASKIVT
jgi:hypothetical protein